MARYTFLLRLCVLAIVAIALVAPQNYAADVTTPAVTTSDEAEAFTDSIIELPLKNSTNGTNEQIYLIQNFIVEVGVLENNSTHDNTTEQMEDLDRVFNKTSEHHDD